jgi:hypothetical protein
VNTLFCVEHKDVNVNSFVDTCINVILFRSQLEYCSHIWYSIYITNINELEKVQQNFLKFLSFQLDGYS